MDVDVNLEWNPGNRTGLGTLTAKIGNEVLAVENLDVTKSRARERFVEEVCEGRKGIDRDAVAKELLGLAAGVTANSASTPMHEDEIEIDRIVRPERIMAPEVSGIAVPRIVTVGGKMSGRYEWYLAWADGRREARAIEPTLRLPDGSQLWISPSPGEPTLAKQPGWSLRARRGWLNGQAAPCPRSLFKAMCKAIAYYLDLPRSEGPGIIATMATWTILSYVYQAWVAVPYLYFGGPIGSGKTTAYDILTRMVYRPTVSSNMTCASLFRTLHSKGGTLLLDEVERLKDVRSPDVAELMSMLLAGYRKGGSATRLEALPDGGYRPIAFDVFGPKVLACIAGLPPALATRALPITMFRAAPGSKKPRRRIDESSLRWQVLRDGLHALALEHGPRWLELAGRSDVCPPMGGRDYELWQPLLALASFIEESGACGLLGSLQDHALKSIETAKDNQTPGYDETLLRLLADAIKNGERPTCGEILERARDIDFDCFRSWSPKGVSNHLANYNLHTRKTNGDRRYCDVALSDLRQIQVNYSMDLSIQAA